MDLHRDEASTFGPGSLTAGALLPYEGRTLLKSPDGLPEGVVEATTDGWIGPQNPILVRGRARILPLAWNGDGSGAGSDEIAAFASQMQAAGTHWAGIWRHLDLFEERRDSVGSYLAALRAAGATSVDAWTYSDTVGVALVTAGDVADGTGSLSLHVVPVEWVSESRAGKAVSGIDVRWSWADVIDLHGAR